MKEKHVFDYRETHRLTGSEEKGLQRAKTVEPSEIGSEGTTESHACSDDLSVEKDGSTTPVVDYGDPKDTADTQHENTEIARVVDVGRCDAPFFSLEEKRWDSNSRREVCIPATEGDDDQEHMFLPGGPIERIVGVVRWLRD